MSDTNTPRDDWDDEAGGADDGALNDPLLRRALAQAPDHAIEPEERLRASIRTLAHEAVAPSLPEGPVGTARPWWQRLLGIGGGGGASRMPWNAAFATVLVGVLVTVMWQREPVPGAEIDHPVQDRAVAQAPVAAPEPVPAPVPPSAPVMQAEPAQAPPPAGAPSPAKSAPPNALDAALAESRAVTEASNRALDAQDRERERLAKETAAARAATAAAEQAADKALQKALAAEQAKEQAKAQAQRQADAVAGAGAGAPAPAPPLAASPRAAGLAAPSPSPAAPMAEAVTPTFEALSQWTRMRITRSGSASRSLPRDEARELGALVGSVALSGVGAQPFTGAVDWRISLERNGRVLAVLELAGGQVSWREGSLPGATGRPGEGALSALRQALEEATR